MKKNKQRKLFFIFFLFVSCIFFIYFFSVKDRKYYSFNMILDDVTMKVWVAQTNIEQKEGLSNFSFLNENEAMLFNFSKYRNHVFWMKNMKFPIDIVWLNKDKKIIFIKEEAQPSDYPKYYNPKISSKYVFEFHDGFVSKHNLRI
jgi:uncharacterized membrane protein (UPF0127 family)